MAHCVTYIITVILYFFQYLPFGSSFFRSFLILRNVIVDIFTSKQTQRIQQCCCDFRKCTFSWWHPAEIHLYIVNDSVQTLQIIFIVIMHKALGTYREEAKRKNINIIFLSGGGGRTMLLLPRNMDRLSKNAVIFWSKI